MAVSVDPTGPSGDVVDRIKRVINFTRRKIRLLQIAVAAAAIFLALGGLITLQIRRAESQELARAVMSSHAQETGALLNPALQAVSKAHGSRAGALESALATVLEKGAISPPYTVSPNGVYAALAFHHGGGTVVNVWTGARSSLCGGPEPIEKLAFSPNGKMLLLCRLDHVTRNKTNDGETHEPYRIYELRDPQTGALLSSRTIPEFHAPEELLWSPDSAMFVATEQFGPFHRFLVSSNERILEEKPGWQTDAIVFSDHHPWLVTCDYLAGSSKVALSDFSGATLWSGTIPNVHWAALKEQDTKLIVEFSDTPSTRSFRVIELDSSGRLKKDTTLLEQDFRAVPLAPEPLAAAMSRRALDRSHDMLALREHCGPSDSTGRIQLCEEDGKSPAVFDARTSAMSPLKSWAPRETYPGAPPLSSPDGSMIAIPARQKGAPRCAPVFLDTILFDGTYASVDNAAGADLRQERDALKEPSYGGVSMVGISTGTQADEPV